MKNQPNYPARPFSEYPVLDVTDWPVESPEPTGDDPKDWLVDPAGQHWLFKPREVKEGWAQGEDWAEKIAAQLAASLGIPTADIELAARGVERGSLSRKIIPAGYTLQPGEVLIAERLADWAVLLTAEGAESVLAPSYDHATSLGFNFLDSRRQAYLDGKFQGVGQWS